MPSQVAGLARRWAVILAGGDGKRLLPLTRSIMGDDRPKQFCALTGGETLLEETRRRVSRVVPEHQIAFMLTRTHESFYSRLLGDVPAKQMLVQPYNHGTAPAIAYSVAALRKLDPHGTVAFFPSDHHFRDDQAFADSMEAVYRFAESDRRVVLLGIAPETPEEAYGWIEPGVSLGEGVCEVRRFWEKPSRRIATQLMRRGCLWNSFVMTGRIGAFQELLRRTIPALMAKIETERDLGAVYSSVPPANFSEQVLAARPQALAVLKADGLGWSDLGEPQRVYSVLDELALALSA